MNNEHQSEALFTLPQLPHAVVYMKVRYGLNVKRETLEIVSKFSRGWLSLTEGDNMESKIQQ